MGPSVECCAASLLCCEDSCCLSDEGEQDLDERKLLPCHGASMVVKELEQPHDAEAAISALVEREIFHLPRPDYAEMYDKQVLEAASRQQAIAWIFKVGPDCIFEPRVLQRMELLVLSTLEWRMGSVTPFSYLDYFVSKFDLSSSSRNLLLSRVIELILSSSQELQFVSYRPSSIAIAAVLCGIQELLPLDIGHFKEVLFTGVPSLLHESSESCSRLISELFLLPPKILKADSFTNSAPRSPMGVLDASFSCDSESTYRSGHSNATAQISSSASKRRKLDNCCSTVRLFVS